MPPRGELSSAWSLTLLGFIAPQHAVPTIEESEEATIRENDGFRQVMRRALPFDTVPRMHGVTAVRE